MSSSSLTPTNVQPLLNQAHVIDDTHAMRTIDTRLGTSFLFALIVAVVGLFVFVFGEPNITTTSSLIPAPRNSSSLNFDGYGQLNVSVRVFAPRNAQSDSCDKILERIPSNNLGCVQSVQGDAGTKSESGIMFCTVNFNCSAKASVRGTEVIMLGLPDAFQTIEWAVWSKDITESSVLTQHVLGPANMEPQKEKEEVVSNVLAGSIKNPSALNFGAIRSIVNDTRFLVPGGCMTGGLRLSWRSVARVQSTVGSENGKHYVAFRFAVEETLFVKVLDLKLTLQNQLSVVITYCLTVIAVMTTVKSYVGLIIDTVCIKLAKKRNTEPPEDVLRRVRGESTFVSCQLRVLLFTLPTRLSFSFCSSLFSSGRTSNYSKSRPNTFGGVSTRCRESKCYAW